MRQAFSIGIVVLGLLGHSPVRGDTLPVDPDVAKFNRETARLEAETLMLNARTANLAARFGAAATAKEGNIGSPEKLAAMGHWTLSAATSTVTLEISKKAADSLNAHCSDVDILITSTEDRRSGAANAAIVDERMAAFTRSLSAALISSNRSAMMVHLGGADAIAGLVGTIDSLVGLLRADYAIADLGATANDLSLRIKVAAALPAELRPRVRIEGLAGPGRANALISRYAVFSAERQGAQERYVKAFAEAENDAQKASLGGVKTLLDAAAALDSALTTPTAGQVPLVQLALADVSSGGGACAVIPPRSSLASGCCHEMTASPRLPEDRCRWRSLIARVNCSWSMSYQSTNASARS